jgi:hypothetical protein
MNCKGRNLRVNPFCRRKASCLRTGETSARDNKKSFSLRHTIAQFKSASDVFKLRNILNTAMCTNEYLAE